MVSFLLDFIESAFDRESLEDEQALFTEIRSRLGTCSAFVQQRWKEIQKDVDGFHSVVECPACQERAMQVDDGKVKCRFCHHSSDPQDAANEYISQVLGQDGRSPKNCPECEHETLVIRATSNRYFCFNCGGEWSFGELVRCWECNELFVGDEEEDGNICNDCFQAKMEKD